jgi:hypothetical protein
MLGALEQEHIRIVEWPQGFACCSHAPSRSSLSVPVCCTGVGSSNESIGGGWPGFNDQTFQSRPLALASQGVMVNGRPMWDHGRWFVECWRTCGARFDALREVETVLDG